MDYYLASDRSKTYVHIGDSSAAGTREPTVDCRVVAGWLEDHLGEAVRIMAEPPVGFTEVRA
jgi:hypothetical protein